MELIPNNFQFDHFVCCFFSCFDFISFCLHQKMPFQLLAYETFIFDVPTSEVLRPEKVHCNWVLCMLLVQVSKWTICLQTIANIDYRVLNEGELFKSNFLCINYRNINLLLSLYLPTLQTVATVIGWLVFDLLIQTHNSQCWTVVQLCSCSINSIRNCCLCLQT